MITLKDVSFSYKHTDGGGIFYTPVFEKLNLTIPSSGITAVIAPSGVGKTTLLELIAGILTPDSGEIIYDAGEGPRVSFVFQEQRLLPWRCATENVKVAAKCSDSEAEAFLQKLGITSELAKKRPGQLSGGQRQRVCIARALAAKSDILLLDEPFTGLDFDNRKIAVEEIKKYALTRPVLLVSHIKEDTELADRTIDIGTQEDV